MTNVIRSEAMAEKAISVRLDAEAQRALEWLLRDGASKSEAMRSALISASRTARGELMAADAKRLANDPANLKLIAELHEFLDELELPE